MEKSGSLGLCAGGGLHAVNYATTSLRATTISGRVLHAINYATT